MAGLSILDRIACRVGIWALRRLYGECQTDIEDVFPGKILTRSEREATRMVKRMRGILGDDR